VATIYPWSQRAETLTRHTTHAWAAAARLLAVGWAVLWPQLFAAMAILAVAENTMSPLGEENFNKRGEEKKPNDMDRALQTVSSFRRLVLGIIPVVLTFQFRQGANSAVSARPS
jgi:hypothetical protein